MPHYDINFVPRDLREVYKISASPHTLESETASY